MSTNSCRRSKKSRRSPLGFLLNIGFGSIYDFLHDAQVVLRRPSNFSGNVSGFFEDRTSDIGCRNEESMG